MSRTDEYKFTKLYKNQNELIDLRVIIESIRTKVYINETPAVGGTNVEFVGASKVFVDYVLYEMDKLEKKKVSLKDVTKKPQMECESVE